MEERVAAQGFDVMPKPKTTAAESSMRGEDAPASVGGRQPSLSRVFIVCLVAVAALFLGYEIVERSWLQDVDPALLYTLHILRGLLSGLIAAVLATIVLLRELARVEPVKLPQVRGSLLRHVQRVRMRTKIVMPMLALAVVPTTLYGLFSLDRAQDMLHAQERTRVRDDAHAKARFVGEMLERLEHDARYVSSLPEVEAVSDKLERDLSVPASPMMERVREAAGRVLGDLWPAWQLTVVDSRGTVVLDVADDESDGAITLPTGEAQRIIGWARTSPNASDSRQMGGRAVRAFRFETWSGFVVPVPLADRRGDASDDGGAPEAPGLVLLLWIPFEHLLARLAPLQASTVVLFDRAGAPLTSISSTDGSAPLFERSSLPAPGEARTDVVVTENALVFASAIGTVDATAVESGNAAGVEAPAFTLMVVHASGPLGAPLRQLAMFLLMVMAIVVLVAGIIGIVVTHYVSLPLSALRRATKEIAGGNLSRKVVIRTGDELEGLADDFNVMIDQLREAHEKLAAWNEQLASEVRRQTERLSRLQAGLARADKMASLGQMTAAVMHEIGNPLAAIKTSVQVAQEDRATADDPLMANVLHEVDRLAAFLRSFSRLARHREPAFASVAIADVIEGVTSLLAPDMRRRGVGIETTIAGEIPAIRADADMLWQLLVNLIINAAEASPSGEKLCVRVESMSAEDDSVRASVVRIEVTDTGGGIDAATLERVWEPFFTTKADGSGLGLGICRDIVRAHDGAITIDSEPLVGTTVRIDLPAAHEGVAVAEADSPHETQ